MYEATRGHGLGGNRRPSHLRGNRKGSQCEAREKGKRRSQSAPLLSRRSGRILRCCRAEFEDRLSETKRNNIHRPAVQDDKPTAAALCQGAREHDDEAVVKKQFHKPPDSKVAAWTLFVGVTVAVIYALQLIAMQDTVKQMEIQTRLSVRPFIDFDEGPDALQATPLKIDGEGNASLEYRIQAKNYSNTPATNVWADANLVVADDLYTVYDQEGYACGDAVIGKPDIGFTVFPGRVRVFIGRQATAKIDIKHQGSQLQAFLAGCIGYRDQFGYLYRSRYLDAA